MKDANKVANLVGIAFSCDLLKETGGAKSPHCHVPTHMHDCLRFAFRSTDAHLCASMSHRYVICMLATACKSDNVYSTEHQRWLQMATNIHVIQTGHVYTKWFTIVV